MDLSINRQQPPIRICAACQQPETFHSHFARNGWLYNQAVVWFAEEYRCPCGMLRQTVVKPLFTYSIESSSINISVESR